MTSVLAGIPGVVIYLDDVVVHGATTAIHDGCLQSVFIALAKHGLTLNGSKCVFSVLAIEYVGFRLSTEGISPLLSNVEAILSIPEPILAAQLASFLGMIGYYMKFMPQYSAITAPLCQLLRRDEPCVWPPECTKAVQTLKAQLTSAPVLAHFDISSHTLVTCDTSAMAVLSQIKNGVERPVAFASRALNQIEQRYSVWEALACIVTDGTFTFMATSLRLEQTTRP